MKSVPDHKPLVAIACGGTGGHLFPGLAVADQLLIRGCDVTLIVSQKEVDQQAVRSVRGMGVITLPAVGLTRRNVAGFFRGFWKSYREARRAFRARPPLAVLAMGGFTSAPPVLAGKAAGAMTFLHESNTIPGRANRWLCHFVDHAFVGFPSAAGHLHHSNVLCTGTPVRPQFAPGDARSSRMALGLSPSGKVLLVMGGSQGASGLNERVLEALPLLLKAIPDLQFLHLTGPQNLEQVRSAYHSCSAKAVVLPFLTEMELAMGAADAAVSRAGASTLAELAAMQLPSVLIPFPFATDNHQLHNALAFADSGAALVLEQQGATGPALASLLTPLLADRATHDAMSLALEGWHHGDAAGLIADRMIALMGARRGQERSIPSRPPGHTPGPTHHSSSHGSSELRASQRPA